MIGLKDRRNQCHALAGQLKNCYSVFEDANGSDLLRAASKLDAVTGVARVELIHALAKRWLKCLPGSALNAVVKNVTTGNPIKAKRPDLIRLGDALTRVRDDASLGALGEVCRAYSDLKESPTYCSREIWHGLASAAKYAQDASGMTLRDAAWHERDRHRRHGRSAPPHCLSTPLLVKGLQFDHAIVLDTADFPSTESLYVAMTRGCRTLSVIGASPLLSTTRAAL